MAQGKNVILLGNFDGVHIGHQALISAGLDLARSRGLSLKVWTFDSVFSAAITDTAERVRLLKSYGVDEVLLENFEKVKGYSPEHFVKKVLCDELEAAVCVCGYNYSFGARGAGTPELLKELCGHYGIETVTVAKVEKNGAEVSSSAIRARLACGDVAMASELLGRRYTLSGVVEDGNKKGRKVGMPTANLYFEGKRLLPKNGVYATITHIEDGRAYPSVTNVGVRPTLDDGRGLSVETHIIGVEAELYFKTVSVEFLAFIREEIKFASLDELSKQVKEDIKNCKKYF